MSFIEKIASELGVLNDILFTGARYLIFDENSGYFEGVKGIKSFCKEEINLYLKKGCLKIKGENLKIIKFCAGDVAIGGKIKEVIKE